MSNIAISKPKEGAICNTVSPFYEFYDQIIVINLTINLKQTGLIPTLKEKFYGICVFTEGIRQILETNRPTLKGEPYMDHVFTGTTCKYFLLEISLIICYTIMLYATMVYSKYLNC
jgi:hypothetical protein